MKLSHVERYLADFIDVIEFNDRTNLHSGAARKNLNGIDVPNDNYWVNTFLSIGTVNVDESTYMFNPKVLDRVNT